MPTVKLVLDAEATVAGYWSDGTVNVELSFSLRNEGDLRMDDAVSVAITCNSDGGVINGCGDQRRLSLPDGYGPASDTLTFRVPAGGVSVAFAYGENETTKLDFNVAGRIVGVDREVWKCFSDTSKLGTIWENDEGIGCAAWAGEAIPKWDQTSPVKVFVEGPEGFVAEFKDVLNGLSPVLNLKFKWVDSKSASDVSAYIGLTVDEVEYQGVYCRSAEAFGCANTETRFGEVLRSEIMVFNVWREAGEDLGDFSDWHRTRFRSAIIHEAVHAFGRMSHRTELLSVMNAGVHHRAELSPMDEALLRLHGHEMVTPRMTMDEIRRLIVFNDELIDPQSVDPRLAAWSLVSNAYSKLRDATSASFSVRFESPGCSERSSRIDYGVGNLTRHHPFFGWTRLDDGEDQVYVLRPYQDQFEYWALLEPGWAEVGMDGFSEAFPGWREGLSDPHHILESILYYADWTDAELSIDSDGRSTLRFELDLVTGDIQQAVETVEVNLIIDGDTYEISDYSMAWKLNDESCDTYLVEASGGRYGIDFAFPDAVRLGSDFIESCDVESLGLLTGYVRRSGSWARVCGRDQATGGYARPFTFSLDDWAFVRFELLSTDDIAINLSREGDSRSTVDLGAGGYLLGGHGVPDNNRLRWAHGPLGPGSYVVETVSEDRALPGTFALIVTAQPTPPPPYRFMSIAAFGERTCGLLLDGTPLCWGRRNVEGDGSAVPDGRFVAISAGIHACALREDGTPVCWEFEDEGEHTCNPKNGSVYCRLNDQGDPADRSRDRDGGTFVQRYVGVTAGYYDQTPPAGETLLSINSGWVHSCGLRYDGTPVCWGSNQHGKASPPAGERFLSINSGTSHSCGVREDGSVVCWGGDWNGLLAVPEGERFVAVTAGEEHSCGLREDGSIACWGSGGLTVCTPQPDGTTHCYTVGSRDHVPPSPPESERYVLLSPGFPNCALREDGSAACWTSREYGLTAEPESERFTSISSSRSHACALREDGTAVCWGRDRHGQASPPSGVNLSSNQQAPPPVGLVSISSGGYNTCALNQDGEATCWGPPVWKNGFSGRYSSISSGERHVCALGLDGAVVCRGSDDEGQSSPPNERFASISSGSSHTCGLRTDGTVECWGQLSPPEDEVFVSISSGGFHACGLRDDGTAACWGSNNLGQASPPRGQVFSSMSAGLYHTCALRLDGTAVCWGLGRGDRLLPPEGEPFTSVSNGSHHTCALRKDGTPVCWGSGMQELLPDNETFVSISSGAFHACGLRVDGTAACWGSNDFGQASPSR